MSRTLAGVVLIVAAIVITAYLPKILGPFSVLGWWFAIGLAVVGMLNICRSAIERWDAEA